MRLLALAALLAALLTPAPLRAQATPGESATSGEDQTETGQTEGGQTEGDEAETDQDEPDDQVPATASDRLKADADALYRQFQSEQVTWSKEAREARANKLSPALMPRHPAIDFWPRFAELADVGSGDALAWMVEQFHAAFDSPEERRERGRDSYYRLFRQFPNATYTVAAIDVMPEHSQTLDTQWCFQELEDLIARSEISEVQARALDGQARLLIRHANRTGERIPGEVRRIWHMVVDGYSETQTARMCSSKLYRRAEMDFREALTEWMATLERIHAEGGGVADWPPAPLHEYIHTYRPLSAAGFLEAVGWVERFYQEFLNAESQGRVAGLRYLAGILSVRYMYSSDPWMDLKFRMMQFLFTEFPDEPGLVEMVRTFEQESINFSAVRIIPVFQPLLENARQPELRAHAIFFLAQTYAKGIRDTDLEEALRLYERLIEEFPDHFLGARSRVAVARMRRTMPGSLAPDFVTKDQDGDELRFRAYRGKVVLLSIGGFWCDPWVLELEREVRLKEIYADEPFEIIAVSTDNHDPRSIARWCRENGLKWRYTLQRHRLGPLLVDWNIEAFPTWIVIDAEGVIRTRNAPWPKTEEVIEELLADLRPPGTPSPRDSYLASLQAASDSGGGLGRIEGRFTMKEGPRKKKRPLTIGSQVAVGCCPEGEEVDATDRSLLVGEDGGIANVVVTLKLMGVEAEIPDEPIVIEQRECRFEPHVVVVPEGGTLRIRNADGVLHDVSSSSTYAQELGLTLAPGEGVDQALVQRERIELSSPTRPWMQAWVYVTDTPYTAVTDESGRFVLDGVPPGEYVILYWHENRGAVGTGRRSRVAVREGESTVVDVELSRSGRRGRMSVKTPR